MHPASKVTLERMQTIADMLREGRTQRVAAASAGITHETYYQWLHTYPDFSDMISQAQADAQAKVEERFHKFATVGEDWRASESWLKRRDREQWGDKLDLTGIPESVLVELLGGGRAATPRAQIADKGVIEGQVDPQDPNRYIPLSQQIRTRRMQKRRAERDGNNSE